MAYKVQTVSPSALSATELCPRYRPNGEDNDAATEGTLLHECLEHLVEQPADLWDSWITTQEVSVEHKGLLEEAAAQIKSIIEPGMQVYTDKQLKPRYRKGKLLRQKLQPGLYPELEVETAKGRHGYIDLLVMLSSGVAVIVDYKFERKEKTHDLQLARYAMCVFDYLPSVIGIEARIIAPRIHGDEIEKYLWSREDIDVYRQRITDIEVRADQSANDPSIAGHPSDACTYCHWSGKCPYQANATLSVVGALDVARSVMIPNGPYAGEELTLQTFTDPATVEQRGLRRAFVKFLTAAIKKWTDDDKAWADKTRDPDTGIRLVDVPGWNIGWNSGRATLDRSRESEIHQAIMSAFNMSIDELFELCEVQESKLVEDVIRHSGCTDAEAKERVARVLDQFKVKGGGYPVWTQIGARKRKLKGGQSETLSLT